jgi:hypothetical protein
LPDVSGAVSEAFDRSFGEEIVRPAIVHASGCSPMHVTSTAYLGPFGRDSDSTLLTLYMSGDGSSVTKKVYSYVLAPSGLFRVLVVVVRYPGTVGDDAIGLLESAERQINEDHASFARARGHSSPIVTFTNTNVLVDPSTVADPRTLAGVTAAVTRSGSSTTGYDFVVSINIDPGQSEGGFATPGSVPGFIYMGNFGQWRTRLTASEFVSVAGAVYHHEVVHHWGWPGTHDWDCNGRYEFNFRVPPVLLGWEDVAGDSVPEILDATPYGRSHR